MVRALTWLALLLALPAGGAAASAAPPVWVTAVHDTRTGQPDRELTRAVAVALALHAPSGDWRIGTPDVGSCATACRVVRISGKRAEVPRYTIEREDLPGRQATSTTLRAPAGTSVFLLAEALAVKCDYLLSALQRRTATDGVVQRRASEEPPPSLGAAPERPFDRPRRLWLGAGPSLLLGLDHPFKTFGVEVTGTVGLMGPLSLHASVGFQELGTGDGEGGSYEYQALPWTLMLGAQWSLARWDFGAFGGMSMTTVWLEFEQAAFEEASAVAVGLALQGQAAFRVTPLLSLGLSLRGAYAPSQVEVVDDEQQLFRLPHLLLSLGLDLTLSF